MRTILSLTCHSNLEGVYRVMCVRYNFIGHKLKAFDNDIGDKLSVLENRGCSFPW